MANVLKVKGMSCQHCVMSIKKEVLSGRVVKAIQDAGFEVIP
jgi:copper chaperone CopZ